MMLAALQAILLVLIGIYIVATVAGHALTWYYYARYDRVYPATGYHPPVSIIKPTKGVDQHALDNFRSFCEQDYPSEYEVLFCVEERSDPVVPVVEQVIEEYPEQTIRLVFSDPQDTRSIGKLKNLIAGYEASAYDVIVLSDSDAHVPSTFLRDTVGCTADAGIGLGFCAPAYEGAQDWAAGLMSISVNELVLRLAPVSLLRMFDGAVGTIMVTRRGVVEQIGGLAQFGRQITEDIPIARAIRGQGYRIHLLKQPARVFHGHDHWARWWSHMHRWRVIIRHYWPVKSSIMNVVDLAPWWALCYLLIALLQNSGVAAATGIVAAALATSLISAVAVNVRFAHNRQIWRSLWVVPIHELLRLPLIIHSWVTNEIIWRGRRFRIEPDCTASLAEHWTVSYERS